MSVIVAVGLIAIAAIAIAYLFPDRSQVWLQWVLTARKIVFGLGALILSLFLLSTGAPVLMAIGAVILLLAALYLIHDPNDEFENAPW